MNPAHAGYTKAGSCAGDSEQLTVHEFRRVDSAVASFRIGIGQYSVVGELPAERIGYNDDDSPWLCRWRIRDIGRQAVNCLHAANWSTLVQSPSEAVSASHIDVGDNQLKDFSRQGSQVGDNGPREAIGRVQNATQ